MIQLIDLSKRFGNLIAVDSINLKVDPGEVFGFLGPNGAGKTTTIKMLAGLIKPTGGKVIIDGWDLSEHPNRAKEVVGFIPDRPFLYEKLTALEFLRFIAGVYDLSSNGVEGRMHYLFDLFGLTDWQNELIESFSHGMKQRLVMASAFIHQPKLIVVDEPMVGLDPKGAKLVKEVFRGFCKEGRTVFMSTHTLEIAEEVCDRIAIIQEGKITAVGSMKELRERTGSEDKKLDSIFFKLTGGEEVKKVVEALRF
ncbi:MAG: ABC transporter [Deltaproteobacteria bacterium DG_8]|nr:MAG: ABC transporter [Deltaproteobacteria bacterium DG_8]